MKRTLGLTTVLLICIALLSLQFSCGTTEEYREGEIQTGADEKVPEVLLLGDKHKAAGIECSQCHEETGPPSEAPKVVCLKCHEDYKEVAASYLDPHNAHYTSTDCEDCHHAHKPSEEACEGCHSFGLQAP